MMMNSSSMDIVNNLTEVLDSFNPSVQDLLSLSSTHEGFSDHHHHQRSQIPFTFTDDITNHPSASHHRLQAPVLNYDSVSNFFSPGGGGPVLGHGCNNMNPLSEADSAMNSSSGILLNNKANGSYKYGGKKRKRNDREMEEPREVVHVRAKRGQATDSHSLAERLRREKINEKLRCLQDLVPGCYKTMGMAVMLDVIINYVRSLQNQIDFLSMKLSAASLFYDFNSNSPDMDAVGTAQGMHGAFEAQLGMEKMVGEGGYGVQLPHQFHNSSWSL